MYVRRDTKAGREASLGNRHGCGESAYGPSVGQEPDGDNGVGSVFVKLLVPVGEVPGCVGDGVDGRCRECGTHVRAR